MKEIFIKILALFFLFGCSDRNSPNTSTKKADSTTTLNKTDKLSGLTSEKVYDTLTKNIGFVGITDEIDSNPFMKILNSDKSLYKSISFKDINNNSEFVPYAYHPDYHLLWFRCISKSKEFYTIIVNENNKNEKLIRVTDKNFKFSTWDQLILNCFSVGFNYSSNPIRISDNNNSGKIDNADEFYNPVLIKNDWLKIKWGNDEHWNYGWIRWKDGNKLLIEIFFFA